ncbi:MAG: hypothetical protein ACLTGB_10615, partial [Blautia caecimuris]
DTPFHALKNAACTREEAFPGKLRFATYNFDSIILTWVDFPVNRRSVPSWDIKRNSMCQREKKKGNLYNKTLY